MGEVPETPNPGSPEFQAIVVEAPDCNNEGWSLTAKENNDNKEEYGEKAEFFSEYVLRYNGFWYFESVDIHKNHSIENHHENNRNDNFYDKSGPGEINVDVGLV